jgi:hypothetical protein
MRDPRQRVGREAVTQFAANPKLRTYLDTL